MEICQILHFSDLHFGRLSLIKDSELNYDFLDFKFQLKNLLNKLIYSNKIKIIIITGDIGSYGKIEDNELIKEFFELFSIKNIPILISIGNHDLKRESIIHNKQFTGFCNFIKKHKNQLKTNLSDNFDKNQSSYYYNPDLNCLFLAINSCVNIEAIPILKKKWNRLVRLIKKKLFMIKKN